MRLFAATIVGTATIGAVFVACGSSSSPQKMDAKVFMDSKVFMDAPGSGSSVAGLGEPCTAGSGAPTQGSCPAGFVCLGNLTNEHGAFCTKTCAQGSGDMCNSGYTGHGLGACVLGVTFGSGSAVDYCGVICEGSGISCPPATCDGMCQGSQTCSAALMNGSGSTVAHACF